MSRVGKKIRELPAGVSAVIKNDLLAIKGPKGELTLKLHPWVTVALVENALQVSVKNPEEKTNRALWGTFSSIIANMITGVTAGFSKQLEINGVGFKVALQGANLRLDVGLSHPIEVAAPAGIKFSVNKNAIVVEGIDKQLVGETAARIRAIKKPEPYKGKGIKYANEVIRRKAGKAATKGATK